MNSPTLRRMKVSSEQELGNWLAKHSGEEQEVKVVTCNRKSCNKFVSCERVRGALGDHGWTAGARCMLNGNLIGHAASHA